VIALWGSAVFSLHLQQRYGNHFLPHVLKKIEEEKRKKVTVAVQCSAWYLTFLVVNATKRCSILWLP
jgi:hypothetical protein